MSQKVPNKPPKNGSRRPPPPPPPPRKGHPLSRALPQAPMPEHLRRLTTIAMIGTLDAPIGSSLAAAYLAAARALIREACRLKGAE